VLSARPVLESDPGHCQNSQILPTPPNYVSYHAQFINIMHKSPAISLNSRSFRFQTHGRKGQGAEGCGQGPGWVQILEPNREKHLNDIRKKTCAHASCKTCSAPASPPRRPNRKIPSLLSCSSDRHRPPRRCLGASCHCPRTTLGPVNHTTRMRTQVTPSPPFE
jgi:hypothetical protein